MNSIFKSALNATMKALPASVAPANQYAKSYAAMLCLLVSADFEFELKEFQDAAVFMERDRVITEENLTVRAANYFRGYTDAIKDVMNANSLDFPSIQTEMIAEVRNVTDEYRPALREVLRQLRSVSGTMEQAIIDRINL